MPFRYKYTYRWACAFVVLFILIYTPSTTLAVDSESAAIQRAVQDSQRAGHQHHDLDKYMSLWTEDAKMIGGRSLKAGPHDFTLTRSQFEAVRKLRYRAPPPKEMKITFEDTKVEVNGDRATLTHQMTFDSGKFVEVVQEQYLLKKTTDGWKAYENRWWPIKMGESDNLLEYADEFWTGIDRQIERTKRGGASDKLVVPLLMAFRFPEAFEAAKNWTEQSPKNAEAWLARGQTALLSGDAEDAEKSYNKALEIDPESAVPEFMRQK